MAKAAVVVVVVGGLRAPPPTVMGQTRAAPCDEAKLLRCVMAEAGYAMTAKACASYDCDGLYRAAKKLAGGDDWDTIDSC